MPASPRRRSWLDAAALAAAAVALAPMGCGNEPVQVLQSGPPTYYEDVTPILADHCWCCHQEGGLASSLEERGQVEAAVADILREVDDGTMPPSNPAASAGCAELEPAALPERRRQVLHDWHEAGMPVGDMADGAALPERCGVLDAADLVPLEIEGYAFDGDPRVESRCFVVDPELEDDRFLTGMRVDPGSTAVRHVLLQPSTPTAPGGSDGFDCALDGPDPIPTVHAAWFSGEGDVVHPEGTGIRLPAGIPLVMRVQYDASLAEGPLPADIRTRIELELVRSVRQEAQLVLLWDDGISLDAGLEDAVQEQTSRLTAGTIHRLGVFMGDFGVAARVTLDGVCLLDEPSWRTPRMHWLASPVSAADRNVTVRCTYDTTGVEEPVAWGDPPDGEVCIASLYVALP